MGMGLRRRGGRRIGRRNRRVGIGRRRRFGRRRRGRGGGLGTLLFLCCMGGKQRNANYGQDVQQLQQQQMLMLQAFGMQQNMQQQPLNMQQQNMQPLVMSQSNMQPLNMQQQNMQQQNFQPIFTTQFPQQPQQQQQQHMMYPPGAAMTFSSEEEKTAQLKEFQADQMELLNEIMKKQAEEKDPEKLQELFTAQNELLSQMNQLQTAGYAYPEAIPTASATAQPQGVPMESAIY